LLHLPQSSDASLISPTLTNQVQNSKMLNKSLVFGLLVAGLMLAPSAASANTYLQTSVQTQVQNGDAGESSTNIQSSQTISVQQQSRKAYSGYQKYSYHYSTPYISQLQNSYQSTKQSGAAVDSSTNNQDNNTVDVQQQIKRILNSQSED
jgi:hypothetical protein